MFCLNGPLCILLQQPGLTKTPSHSVLWFFPLHCSMGSYVFVRVCFVPGLVFLLRDNLKAVFGGFFILSFMMLDKVPKK